MDRGPVNPPATTGIEQEIASIYAQEAGGILRYACAFAKDREIACDALQEAFFRLFLCRSAGQEIRSPKGWLFRVVRNYILDQRKACFGKNIDVEALVNLPGPVQEIDRGPSDLLQALVDIGLSDREMECVRLRTEDLRYEEIAAMLGIQAGTVGALIARAHVKIRKVIGDRSRQARDFDPTLVGEKRYAS